MEIGLIHPPVGLNIYIVSSIAPDVPLTRIMWGTIPYVLCMFLAIVILCVFPEIATWLPDHMMGQSTEPRRSRGSAALEIRLFLGEERRDAGRGNPRCRSRRSPRRALPASAGADRAGGG